jgi:hypothetical protein
MNIHNYEGHLIVEADDGKALVTTGNANSDLWDLAPTFNSLQEAKDWIDRELDPVNEIDPWPAAPAPAERGFGPLKSQPRSGL